jgi:hypothetical protein
VEHLEAEEDLQEVDVEEPKEDLREEKLLLLNHIDTMEFL